MLLWRQRQAIGLENTTATRGAFLIQATALLTPLLATLAGESLGSRLWVGCLVALLGSILIALDHPASSSASASSFIRALLEKRPIRLHNLQFTCSLQRTKTFL